MTKLIFILSLIISLSSAAEPEINPVVMKEIRDDFKRNGHSFHPMFSRDKWVIQSGKYSGLKQTQKSYRLTKTPKSYNSTINTYSSKFKKEIVRKLQQKYSLTKDEIRAILYYSGSGYGKINRYMRGIKPGQNKTKKLSALLIGALCKLDTYQGEVKRHAHLPKSIANSYHSVGGIVMDPGFASTSHNKNWHWGGSTRMYIKSKTCRELPISSVPGEGEVLCLPGTAMKIKEVKKVKKGHAVYTAVQMEEIGPLYNCNSYKTKLKSPKFAQNDRVHTPIIHSHSNGLQ